MNEELPLPEPAFSGWDYDSLPAVQRDGYTADQMREYAKRAITDERDECACLCDALERTKVYGAKECAEGIRARGNT